MTGSICENPTLELPLDCSITANSNQNQNTNHSKRRKKLNFNHLFANTCILSAGTNSNIFSLTFFKLSRSLALSRNNQKVRIEQKSPLPPISRFFPSFEYRFSTIQNPTLLRSVFTLYWEIQSSNRAARYYYSTENKTTAKKSVRFVYF